MTNDKVNEVFRRIISQLWDYQESRVEGIKAEFRIFDPAITLGHCKAIARLAIDMPADRLEKKFRWLGFCQGVLWACGMNSLDELKRANMPSAEEPSDE
jgi:hypothetical protein